jgi:hypothetical protein
MCIATYDFPESRYRRGARIHSQGITMNRLALLIACLATAGICRAEDPAFCKSMCASEQNACRADARLRAKEEPFTENDLPRRNPFARTAQEAVRTPDLRALDAAGDQSRRTQRLGSCDATYQRCTRGCAASALAPAPARELTPASARANTLGGK